MAGGAVVTRRLTAENLRLTISSRSRIGGLDDLAGRTGHLMVSIKNGAFNARMIAGFCRFAETRLAHGYVTVVDQPYIHNARAASGSAAELQRKLAGIGKLCRDRTRQVERILEKHSAERLSLLSWEALSKAVPSWLADEVTTAFHRKGAFRAALSEQSRRAVANYDEVAYPEHFEAFLLEETPVLLYCYYLLDGGVIDFYPGELPAFFRDIERGRFGDELPETTRLARSHPGLVYAEIALG